MESKEQCFCFYASMFSSVQPSSKTMLGVKGHSEHRKHFLAEYL